MDWPDWSAHPVAIVASGPSAKLTNLEILRGRAKVIAIKESIELCPWADAVYGCDPAWWRFRRGLPDFHGLKITWAGNSFPEWPDIRRVEIARGIDSKYARDFLFDGKSIGGGGNSGFQAVNIAAAMLRAKRIALVGFDMTDDGGLHWYGRNHWPMAGNPDRSNFRRWLDWMHEAAPALKQRGIQVVNTSRSSALKCFPVRSLEQIMRDWA